MEERDDSALVRAYCAGRDVACPRCKYNLRDLKAEACPECGTRPVLEFARIEPRWLVTLAALALFAAFAWGGVSGYRQWHIDGLQFFAGQLEVRRAAGLLLMNILTCMSGAALTAAGLLRWRRRAGAGRLLVRSRVVFLAASGLWSVVDLAVWTFV